MSGIAGNIADVAFALQSAKGSPASASQWRLRLQGGQQPHVAPTKADFEETTGQRMLSDTFYSGMQVAGAPTFYCRPEALAVLAYGVLGSKAVSGSGPYVHTLTPATALPYFTFWRSLGNGLYEKFPDCVITALRLEGTSGMPLMATPTIVGLSASHLTSAEATATIETAYALKHDHGANAYDIAGTAIRHLRRFVATIDNGATIVPGDTLFPFDVVPGRLSAVVEGEMLQADFAAYKTQVYGSASPSDGAATVTAPVVIGDPGLDFTWDRTADDRSLQLLLPRVFQDPIDPQPNVSGEPLTQTVTWRAYQPASGAAVTLKVENGTASYAAA